MIDLHPQYVIDAKGDRTAVMLPVEEFHSLLRELEMREDVAAYDRAREEGGPSISYDAMRRELGLAE